MNKTSHHMFGLDEAAMAYALAAENVIGNNASFVNANPAVVPVFVSMLFQSLKVDPMSRTVSPWI